MSKGSDRSRKHAIGILFGRQHLHACRATTTLFGSVRYDYACVEVLGDDGDEEALQNAFSRLLEEFDVGEPMPIAGAVPTSECYFATRPINSGGGTASPRTLLRESLRSSSAKLDQLSIDVLNWQPDRRPLVSIVAAPLRRVETIRNVIGSSPHSLQRLEPSANALISSAVENERGERRERLVTRVFLGDGSLLAVMTKGTRAIHWQSMPLPQGDEGTGIVSIVRSVEAAYSACGLDSPPSSVSIYGRKELETLVDRQWLAQNLPDDFRWLEAPSMQPQHIARACADCYLSSEEDEFDFVREFREPMQLRRVVPYKDIALYAIAVLVLFAVLFDRLKRIESQYAAVMSTAPVVADAGSNPRSELDRLNARATAVSQFLDKRVVWSPMLGEIAAILPPGTRLTEIRGSAIMAQKRKRAVKTTPTTLVLKAECLLDDENQLPLSVSQLPERVSRLESVSTYFDRVELGDLRRKVSRATGIKGADFSIVLTTNDKTGP